MTELADPKNLLGVNPAIVGGIEVTLEALLGEARLTLAALAALKAGGVVTLAAPLNHPVELRLNGAVVARGELVAVGEQFGVRLTEVSSDAG